MKLNWKHRSPLLRITLFTALSVLLQACSPSSESQDDALVVYSARKEHLVKPLFDEFTRQTGIEVTYITDSAGPLLARLSAEGADSPADLLITVDAGNLWQAAERGVLAPIDSAELEQHVPDYLQDPENRWFGLSIRARTIVYSTERVDPAQLSTYEALAQPAWKDRLCLRTSKKVYNQSLVASLIAAHGEASTESLVKQWVANLALPPFSNDTRVIEAIDAGQCDVGVVNSYYLGRLQAGDTQPKVALFWANQGEGERGVHVNISGAGVVEASKNKAQAQRLLEWLTGEQAQAMIAELNLEFPVNDAVEAAGVAKAWGAYRADDLPVHELGERQAQAIRLMDRAEYR